MIAGQEPMLNTGIKVGPYEIVAMLRAGGMCEVYRAYGTKLNHDAAFKGLPMPFVALPGGWPPIAECERELGCRLPAINGAAHVNTSTRRPRKSFRRIVPPPSRDSTAKWGAGWPTLTAASVSAAASMRKIASPDIIGLLMRNIAAPLKLFLRSFRKSPIWRNLPQWRGRR